MASGFFLGGLADSLQTGITASNQAKYQQGILQLEQQRLQQQQHNELINRADKERATLLEGITNFADAYNVAHANDPQEQRAKAISQAVSGYKQMLMQQDKILGRDPASTDAQIAMIAATPPKTQTEGALARAKEGPQKQALVQSEINRNNAISGVNPDSPAPGQGLGSGRVAQAFDTLNDATGPSAEDAVKQKYDARTLFKAEQYLSGNTSVLTGLGYGRQGASARKQIQDAAADLAIARNIKPEQVNAEIAQFMGQKRAASQAGMRVGNVTVAMDAAQAASKRVLETSDKVNRTQYPSINSVLLAAAKGTGDPNVVQYGIAVNTLVNNYARAVGGGNAQLTDSARQEAIENLNVAWSKGQIKAAVEQINKEIASELSGAQKAMKDVTSGQKEDPMGLR